MVFLKKVVAEDFENIYPLLAEFEGSVITKDRWRQLFVNNWDKEEDYFGYAALDQDKVVGFLGAIFSNRIIDNEKQKFCNITSWIVKKEYRPKGFALSLLLEVLKLKDYTITNLTARNETVSVLRRLGFKELERVYKIVPFTPVPAIFSDRCQIETDPEIIKNLLDNENLKIYNDHLKFAIIHLLIKTEQGNCYLIVKKARRHKLSLAQIHYISDLDIFLSFHAQITARICLRLKVFGLLIEERFLRGHKIRNCINSWLPYPGKWFKSDRLDKVDIVDNLYTELLVLDL